MGVSTKQGATGDDAIKDKCVELDKANKDERQKFVDEKTNKQNKQGLNQEESSALDKADRGGMTYSSASSTCSEPATDCMTQSSNGLANAHINEDLDGGTSEQKMGLNKDIRADKSDKFADEKKKAGVLCGGSHVHPGAGYGAHAEAKIVNNLSNAGGSMSGCSMVLNIDWRRNLSGGGVQNSGMPCTTCYKMLCHAASPAPDGCDIEIVLCGKENEPVRFDSSACPDGYEELSRAVDGRYPPGRV